MPNIGELKPATEAMGITADKCIECEHPVAALSSVQPANQMHTLAAALGDRTKEALGHASYSLGA